MWVEGSRVIIICSQEVFLYDNGFKRIFAAEGILTKPIGILFADNDVRMSLC